MCETITALNVQVRAVMDWHLKKMYPAYCRWAEEKGRPAREKVRAVRMVRLLFGQGETVSDTNRTGWGFDKYHSEACHFWVACDDHLPSRRTSLCGKRQRKQWLVMVPEEADHDRACDTCSRLRWGGG